MGKKSRRACNGARIERNGMNSHKKDYGCFWDHEDWGSDSPDYRRFRKRQAGKSSRRAGKYLLREYMRD